MFLAELKLGTAAVVCACMVGSITSLGSAQGANLKIHDALPCQDCRLVPEEKKSIPFPIEITHTKNGVEVKAPSFRAVSHTSTVDVGKQSLVLTGKTGHPVVLFCIPAVPGADPMSHLKQFTGMRITVNLADGSFRIEGATKVN